MGYDALYFSFIDKGLGIFGGLFHTTCTTSVFHIFIMLISSVILLLTSFYPRKGWAGPLQFWSPYVTKPHRFHHLPKKWQGNKYASGSNSGKGKQKAMWSELERYSSEEEGHFEADTKKVNYGSLKYYGEYSEQGESSKNA